jgi:hypothetical protein
MHRGLGVRHRRDVRLHRDGAGAADLRQRLLLFVQLTTMRWRAAWRSMVALGALMSIVAACSGSTQTERDADVDGAAGISCTLAADQCPAGYRCGCGSAGPAANCTCHKQCTSDADCIEPGTMCGCTSLDPAPRICVNACFCSCD